MAERGFTDPVKVSDVEQSHQSVKSSRLERYQVTLMLYGFVLGVAVTLLFGVGLLVIGAMQ